PGCVAKEERADPGRVEAQEGGANALLPLTIRQLRQAVGLPWPFDVAHRIGHHHQRRLELHDPMKRQPPPDGALSLLLSTSWVVDWNRGNGTTRPHHRDEPPVPFVGDLLQGRKPLRRVRVAEEDQRGGGGGVSKHALPQTLAGFTHEASPTLQ